MGPDRPLVRYLGPNPDPLRGYVAIEDLGDRAILLGAWALREPDVHRDSHRLIDLRSLALHRLVAVRMRTDPGLFDVARGILDRWMERADDSARPLLTQWARLMDQGLEVALKVAEEDSEQSAQLRQSSPLVCVLSEPERHWLLREWRRLVNELPRPMATRR